MIAAPEPTRRPQPRTDRWTAQQRHTAALNAARIALGFYGGDAARGPGRPRSARPGPHPRGDDMNTEPKIAGCPCGLPYRDNYSHPDHAYATEAGAP